MVPACAGGNGTGSVCPMLRLGGIVPVLWEGPMVAPFALLPHAVVAVVTTEPLWYNQGRLLRAHSNTQETLHSRAVQAQGVDIVPRPPPPNDDCNYD